MGIGEYFLAGVLVRFGFYSSWVPFVLEIAATLKGTTAHPADLEWNDVRRQRDQTTADEADLPFIIAARIDTPLLDHACRLPSDQPVDTHCTLAVCRHCTRTSSHTQGRRSIPIYRSIGA